MTYNRLSIRSGYSSPILSAVHTSTGAPIAEPAHDPPGYPHILSDNGGAVYAG
jgi:hypothetical protein